MQKLKKKKNTGLKMKKKLHHVSVVGYHLDPLCNSLLSAIIKNQRERAPLHPAINSDKTILLIPQISPD